MFLGLDIGGTKVAGVLVAQDGEVLRSSWTDQSARNADDVCRLLGDTALQLTSGLQLGQVSAGVSIAGMVGSDGLVTRQGLPELDRADVGGMIRDSIGLRMLVVNDAEATLRAAIAHDRRDPVSDAVLLALGTGVAGAVMCQGRLLRGRWGLAGELGHLPVLGGLAYRCVCGGVGCLEQYASGRGITERAVAAAQAGQADDMIAATGASADQLTAIQVVAAAHQGIESALALVDDAAEAVAQALVAVGVIAEPARSYLAGSLGHAAADLLIPRIEERMEARWPFAAALPPPSLILDQVGPYAAAVGAALLARDESTRS